MCGKKHGIFNTTSLLKSSKEKLKRKVYIILAETDKDRRRETTNIQII